MKSVAGQEAFRSIVFLLWGGPANLLAKSLSSF